MPIKFLKFARRKSVGNPLEATYEPANQGSHQDDHDAGSGFRVLPQRNRGSGHTTGSSAYSGADYGGSSNRLSSNSTLPSTDTPRTPDEYRPQGHSDPYSHSSGKPGHNTGANRSVGNTLSPPSSRSTMSIPKLETTLDTSSLFGDDMFDFVTSRKDKKEEGPRGGFGSVTPTAPKIASNPIINPSDNNHYGIVPAPPPKSYDPSPTSSRFPTTSGSAYTNIFTNSHHMDADRPSNNESSPYHWDSKPSEDLLSPGTSNSPRSSRNLTPGQKAAPVHTRTDSLEAPPLRSVQKRNSREALGVRKKTKPYQDDDAAIVASSAIRVDTYGSQPQPKSSPARGTLGRLSDKSKDRDSGWEETVPSRSPSDHSPSGSTKDTVPPPLLRGHTDPYDRVEAPLNTTTPKSTGPGLVGVQLRDEQDEDDFSITAAAALAARYESEPKQPTTRVMTRAQFERFQQQQDDLRRLSGNKADDDSDESDYEEESDAEKNKEMARQRARQEAHLSVYRQQMMKISGTDRSEAPLLGMKQASLSTSALPTSSSSIDPGSSGKNSDEEEDEEIPLGILMAHGFPSRNRPPTRLSNSSSQPNLRAAAQNQQLPVFARHLPQDPYNIGAGLVNPMNRSSLAFGAGSGGGSVSGGSMYNGIPPSQPLQSRGPGGLVGEIVRAEEQKAFRRGLGGGAQQYQSQSQSDPFKQDPFDRPASRGGGGLLGGMHNSGMGGMNYGAMGGNTGMGMGMGMGANGIGQGMGMGMGANGIGQGMGMGMGANGIGQGMGMGMGGMQPDAFQAQMATMQQQYMQMQQMQMQFMQMQMQMQNSPQQKPQPLIPPMPLMGQQRPTTMMSMHAPLGGLGIPQQGQPRAMSMVDNQFPQLQPPTRSGYAPSISPGQHGIGGHGFLGTPPGYTPSIAPSERSTIGQPSRYRPVTYQPGTPLGGRTSTLTSGSAGHDWNRKSPGPSNLKNSTTDSDEDEDNGWEELNKKRKEKADGWRKRKEAGGLKGVLNFGSTSSS